MVHHDNRDLLQSWPTRLGLAATELLPSTREGHQRHFAFLDGVEGSFALSTEAIDTGTALDWTWSSQLCTHIELEEQTVLARQVSPNTPVLRFQRTQVEANIERFFDELTGRRIEPVASIADHFVQCFRSHRHIAARCELTDDESLATFLTMIDDAISGRQSSMDPRLPTDHRDRLNEELRYSRLVRRNTDLAVTMRHAAGMVFQETHAELETEPVQGEFFGLPTAPRRSTRNRAGAYYTPPGLARVLTDLAVTPYLDREVVRIADPACGSGIFLSEAVRALRAKGFRGRIKLIGIDVSKNAVDMARFTLKHNEAAFGAEVQLKTGDFLTSTSSLEADVILMNPPFIAAPNLPPKLRDRAKEILGPVYAYRPDLSMVFTTLALKHLNDHGTLATLVPGGALGQERGQQWRNSIIEGNDVDLIALLGDHGLFRDAIVNIGALVLRSVRGEPQGRPVMLWAGPRNGASSAALRRLRRWHNGDHRTERTLDWSIQFGRRTALLQRRDWTPRPDILGELPDRLGTEPRVLTVGELFNVELGIRGGRHKNRLQLSTAHYGKLPKKERKLFRPVAETRSIRGGKIHPASWAFYPDTRMTCREIADAAPVYFERFLQDLGLADDAHVEFARARRLTNTRRAPRIVARAFFSSNSFAVDADGSHVVVQGFSWLPKNPIADGVFEIVPMLTDYAFVLNSRLFFSLARESSAIVAGGQVDGAKRHVSHIPLPDLPSMYLDFPEMKREANRLRQMELTRYPDLSELDRFAAMTYRTELQDWSITR